MIYYYNVIHVLFTFKQNYCMKTISKFIYLHLDFTFCVIKFTIPLLGIAFVILLASSIQSISADHTEPGIGIFKDESLVTLIQTQNTNYLVYLQIQVRNGDGQLINVTESTKSGAYIPHELTDHVFDTLMGQKEIIVIDNIKYEKVQYAFSPTLEERWVGLYPIFSENLNIKYEVDENVRVKMDKKIKDYSIWKIHYCATFEGHGYRCIPIFQTLIPTMTLEPNDTPNQIWTILREVS